jgi:imidazolonepropionase-like amidohydrolase
VGLGTDSGCPFITHYDMWREVYYFAKYCDVTPSFALHTATQVNAQILGLGDETGSLEPGKSADLIVCEGNPLEDLTQLRTLRYVMCRGKLIKKPRPKRMARVDKALDRYL